MCPDSGMKQVTFMLMDGRTAEKAQKDGWRRHRKCGPGDGHHPERRGDADRYVLERERQTSTREKAKSVHLLASGMQGDEVGSGGS